MISFLFVKSIQNSCYQFDALQPVAVKVYSISCNFKAVMINKDVVNLKNYIYLLKVVPVSRSGTCLTCFHDGLQVIDIKVEVTDIQEETEEEDPLSGTFPVIKPEHEVSCMSVCTFLHTFHS